MENRIREIRNSLGLSQDALAEKSGISRPFLSTIETGKAVPTVATAIDIATVLGVTMDELFPKDRSRWNKEPRARLCWDSDVLLPLNEIACAIRLIGEGANSMGSDCGEMVLNATALIERNLWDIYELINDQQERGPSKV